MPLYEYRCETSGKLFERTVPLARYKVPQFCACGDVGVRVISAPRISVENVDYTCPITGQWIGSKRAHEENLKVHNCRVYETGEMAAAAKYREEQESQLDRKVEETVEKEFEAMPSEKKEKLANELLSGADLAYTRGTAQ